MLNRLRGNLRGNIPLHAPAHLAMSSCGQRLGDCCGVYNGGDLRRTILPPCQAAASKKKTTGGGFGSSSKTTPRQRDGGGRDSNQSSPSSSYSPNSTAPCPCGSKLPYKECCSAQHHQGAWAKTAVEVAMARFSARLLDLPEFLADSAHPESLGVVGGRRQTMSKASRLNRKYRQINMRRVDLCHGPGKLGGGQSSKVMDRLREEEVGGGSDQWGGRQEQEKDSWIVAMACEYDRQGGDNDDSDDEDNDDDERDAGGGRSKKSSQSKGKTRAYLTAERYVQQDGRWVYLSDEDDIPTSGPFHEFIQRHCRDEGKGGGWMDGGEDGMGDSEEEGKGGRAGLRPDGAQWTYGYRLTRPAYALQGTSAEDAVMGPSWFLDDIAAESFGRGGGEGGRHERSPRRRPEGLVYLDDYLN